MGRIGAVSLAHMDADELTHALTFASACAAFTCTRRGADPPCLSEIGGAKAGFS
jgi:fructokinase